MVKWKTKLIIRGTYKTSWSSAIPFEYDSMEKLNKLVRNLSGNDETEHDIRARIYIEKY